jgi:1-acyl-sn-glycerol-3-phosphate acyltransferase
MSFVVVLYWILGSNLIFSFTLSLVVYIRSQKYYRPLIKKDKDNNPIDLHKIYDAFHPHDDVCFIQLWFGAFCCGFIKVLSSLFIVLFVNWHIRLIKKCYKNYDTNPEQRKKMKDAVSCWSWAFLFMNGVLIERKHPEYKEVYKKYLGEDYDFTDDKYSLITSNHIGFFEVVLCMALYAPGFMAKKVVENYCFIGPISSGLNCFFVDRQSEKDKKIIFDQLLQRQQSFYNGTFLAPLVMFPEGTCSCGRNILRFKKGSFYSLLPIKPQIVSVNQEKSYHLSVGASNVVLGYSKNLCHFFNTIYVAILPTIRPTDYMFEKYKHLGKEKWEIYMNVVRKIYSEVGGLEEVNMGLRDINRYIKAMRTGFYDPNEDMDYEKQKIDNKDNKDNKDMDSEEIEINTQQKEVKIDDANEEEKKENIEVKEDNYENIKDDDFIEGKNEIEEKLLAK